MVAGGLVLLGDGRAHRRVRPVRPGGRHRRRRSPRSLYLAVVGSLIAFTTYGWLLRVAPLPLVATYAYVNPVVAVILGAIVLQEPIDGRTLVAGGGHRRSPSRSS